MSQIVPFNRMPNSAAGRDPACGSCPISHVCFFGTSGPATFSQAELDRMEQERFDIERTNPVPKDCPIPF